ncbi:hypothetical protein AAC03nite_39550 [Alicyclobacillus acidoterrestris]|nr:hypothetical protein AAC03nite_39550 [Alicyclobacillus acidoterrestris]
MERDEEYSCMGALPRNSYDFIARNDSECVAVARVSLCIWVMSRHHPLHYTNLAWEVDGYR